MTTHHLPNGRSIEMVKFHLEETYAGVYEGSRETASSYILRDLREQVTHLLPPAKPLLIVHPRQSELPRWLCVAKFNSYSGAHADFMDAGSRLYVCWFTDDTSQSLAQMVEAILPEIYWEKFAEDYDMMDF